MIESDRLVLRAVTDEIMYAIMDLSHQEYVDEDAQKAKAEREEQQRKAIQLKAEAAYRAEQERHRKEQAERNAAELAVLMKPGTPVADPNGAKASTVLLAGSAVRPTNVSREAIAWPPATARMVTGWPPVGWGMRSAAGPTREPKMKTRFLFCGTPNWFAWRTLASTL